MKKLHENILTLVKQGYKNPEIRKSLNVPDNVIFYVKRKYKDNLALDKSLNTGRELAKYDAFIDNDIKTVILNTAYILRNKDISSLSQKQLVDTLSKLIPLERLIAGKSTANIAEKIVHSLDSNQLEIINKAIKSLKESMLDIAKP